MHTRKAAACHASTARRHPATRLTSVAALDHDEEGGVGDVLRPTLLLYPRTHAVLASSWIEPGPGQLTPGPPDRYRATAGCAHWHAGRPPGAAMELDACPCLSGSRRVHLPPRARLLGLCPGSAMGRSRRCARL